ncbi:MAG TPA: hypothetical protein VHY75_06450 [Steroidobacteraceae bacterium]|nr:hypothetical protein [Steroidobacteraceae bacterium]
MATPINAPLTSDFGHLSVDDLLEPILETPRLGGPGPFVINLIASSAPLGPPAKDLGMAAGVHVYQIQRTEDHRPRYRLRVGPFITELEAEVVLAIVRDVYPGALTATADSDDLRALAAFRPKSGGTTTPALPAAIVPPATATPAAAATPAATPPPATVPTAAPSPAAAPRPIAVAPAAAPRAAVVPPAAAEPPLAVAPSLAVAPRLAAAPPLAPRRAAAPPLAAQLRPPAPLPGSSIPVLSDRVRPAAVATRAAVPARATLGPPATVERAATRTVASQPAAAKRPDAPGSVPNLESTQTLRPLTASELQDSTARWYIIQLSLSKEGFDPDSLPNLDIFNEYRLYSVAGLDQGHVVHSLRLGFFAEEGAAAAVAGYLGAFYDKPAVKRISVAERERFRDQRVEARKDIGATGRHAVIEITGEMHIREKRAHIASVTPLAPAAAFAQSTPAPRKNR